MATTQNVSKPFDGAENFQDIDDGEDDQIHLKLNSLEDLLLSANAVADDIDLPAEVEEVLEQLGMKSDPVDQADFSVVDYINNLFPSEQSLSNIEDVLAQMQRRIQELDDETRDVIRGQGICQEKAQNVVQEATEMIQTLFAKIHEVQDRATRSEEMVRDITRDIQQLDQAKKNLTWSITTLNNLNLLIEALERLKVILCLKTDESTGVLVPVSGTAPQTPLPYSEVVDRLSQATHVLDQVLGRYVAMPIVKQLDSEFKSIKSQLASKVTKDFKDMLSGPGARNLQSNASILQSCCHVLDLLDSKIKSSLISWFLDLQLSEYNVLFEDNQSTAWLDKIDHRYTWLRNCLSQIEKKFVPVFPKSWNIMERIVVEFCRITKSSLTKIMNMRKPEMTHNLLVFAIQRTHTFETNLAKSFTGEVLLELNDKVSNGKGERSIKESITPDNPFYNEVVQEETEEKPDAKPQKESTPFDGIISSCFEEHMHLYIDNVDKQLHDQLVNRLIGDLTINESSRKAPAELQPVLGDGSERNLSSLPEQVSNDPGENALCSATDLFLMYKKVLKQALQLSRGNALLLLTQVLKKYLREYCNQVLTGQLPIKKSNTSGMTANQIFQSILKEEQSVKLSKEDLHRVCVILCTASYCLKTAEDLERKLKEEINSSLSSQINFSAEVDLFGQCRGSCVQLLATDLELVCEPALYAMAKLPWSTIESVGDQSTYVTTIVKHFRTNVPVIRDTLYNVRAYFTQFCIKFANSFIANFLKTLFKCRAISTEGAEQLLLDTHSLKTALLDMPVVNTKFHPPPPKSFSNVVLQGMGKAELIIKAVMTPVDNPNAFVDSFKQLLPECDASEFQKVLDMKGVRRQDQLIDIFREKHQSSTSKRPTSENTNAPSRQTPNLPQKAPSISPLSHHNSTSTSSLSAMIASTQEATGIKKLEKIIKRR